MRLASLLFLMGLSGVAGWEIRRQGYDVVALRTLNDAWEKRILKDAQLIRAELDKGSYQRSVIDRNQELNGLADPSTTGRVGVNSTGRIPSHPGSIETV